MDLISRQAVLDVVCKYCEYYYNENVIQSIKEIPSQSLIIRCKDCKHYLSPHGCGHIDGMVTSQEDGFCSYAERRINENNNSI